LKYLNDKMTAASKPRIKSINSQYGAGDLVLIKDGKDYHVGAYNGVYLEIVRACVEIPKSEIELELDRRREEEEKKLQELEMSELTTKTDRDLFLEAQEKKRNEYFEIFKKKHGIPDKFTMDVLFKEVPKMADAFDDYVAEQEGAVESEAEEFLSSDFGDDDE